MGNSLEHSSTTHEDLRQNRGLDVVGSEEELETEELQRLVLLRAEDMEGFKSAEEGRELRESPSPFTLTENNSPADREPQEEAKTE